jgi:hypothetical protein
MSNVNLDLFQADGSAEIWTPEVGESFYRHIYALSAKSHNPREPQDYTSREVQRSASELYTLSYEQELRIADHFAFLAHVEEGVEFVSAVSLEECHNPPSLTIRLASNHTPTAYVTDGLRNILDIVKEHAREGGF